MSKGTRSLTPGNSLLGCGLVVAMAGILLTSIACQELTTEASPSSDTTIAVASSSTDDTTGGTSSEGTGPAGSASSSTLTTAPPGGSGTPPEATTTTRLLYRPTTPSLITFTLTWTRFEEMDHHLSYDGMWPSASGCKYTERPGSVKVLFEGSQVRFVALRLPNSGTARLSLDGGVGILVDTYSPTDTSGVVWTSPVLAWGRHELKIEWTGLRNPASFSHYIYFDAVEVIGTLVY